MQLSVPEPRQLQPLLLSCARRRARCPAARHTHTGAPHAPPGYPPRRRQDPKWPGTRSAACSVVPPSMTPPGRRGRPACRARTSPLRRVQVGSRCPGLNCASQLYARRCSVGRSLLTVSPFGNYNRRRRKICTKLQTTMLLSARIFAGGGRSHVTEKYFKFNLN